MKMTDYVNSDKELVDRWTKERSNSLKDYLNGYWLTEKEKMLKNRKEKLKKLFDIK